LRETGLSSRDYFIPPEMGECVRVRNCPAGGDAESPQKLQNSGNEAKKYLKRKDITFFNAANYVHFARRFAQIAR
jgi:hypothetical protein